MRKVLALVLALAMVLGCFASVFAAEYTDVKADADYATAVSVLSDLGVVSGYNDGTYKPENVVTRAEMAALIVKALGLTPSASATTNFSDVPATHWASGYVAYANSLGIIAGYTDGTFKPSKTVSYDEALTMIISALGYTADSLEGNTWPAAYVMKAQMLGITEDVDVLGSVGANRGDIAMMLYNTLDQAIGKTNKDGDFVENGTTTKPDNMFVRLGAKETKTIVADKNTSSVIDLTKYYGAEVDVVLNSKGKVIAVTDVNTEFLTGKLKDGTTIKIGSTVVLAGAFSDDTVVYKNGAAAGKNQPADGKYTFAVKYNDDGDIKEVVSAQSWNATKTFKVAANVKAGATKIDSVQLPTKTANGKTVLDTSKFELVGVDSIEAIKKGNVVTYYEGAGVVVKVEVGTEVVTGKVTKLNTAGDTATINGKSYEVAEFSTFTFDKTTVFKTSYDYYLDYAGDVFYAEATKDETTDAYAVLLDAAETSAEWKSGSSTWQIKLFTAEGKTETVKAKVDDGTKYIDEADLVKANFNKVVEVEFDEDGVAIALDFVDFAADGVDDAGAAAEINAKGAIAGKYFASDAVIFTFEKDGDDYEWSILAPAKAVSLKVPNASYIMNDKGQIKLFCTKTAASDADAIKGIFLAKELVSSSKYEVTFMVDGKVETYTTTATFNFTGEWGKITFSGDAPQTLTEESDNVTVAITSAAAINGNTYTDGTDDYALDAAIVVYVVDSDDEVTVGTTADLIDDDYSKVVLYDVESTADGVFEVAVVFE